MQIKGEGKPGVFEENIFPNSDSKVTFSKEDFDLLKKEAFKMGPVIFEAYGDIERIINEKIKAKLGTTTKTFRFVGLDTYEPADFSTSFFQKENFHKLSSGDERSFSEITGIQSNQKLIVIANYVLHHQKAKLPEFLRRCAGATTIILDEPVERKKWENVDYRFAVIAYDMLANMAINPQWAESFLKNPDEFFVDYIFTDELEGASTENTYFGTSPVSSLTKIKSVLEVNLFEKDEVAKGWVEMLKLDHSTPEKSDRVMVAYPYILNWLKENNLVSLLDIGSGEGYLGSIIPATVNYKGVEPSKPLVETAKKQYSGGNLEYVLGSAYNTGLPNENTDGIVSVMVWFHLADLNKAAVEVFRNLKPGGKFLIITSNSLARKIWESFYQDLKVEGNILIGKFSTPQSRLEESVIYLHPNEEIANSFKNAGLVVEKIEPIGLGTSDDTKIFVAISGFKNN